MAKPDPLYALEKLGEAVYDLATGTSPVQELCEAFVYLHRIQPEDIPDPELRRVLVGVKDDLSSDVPDVQKGKEGGLGATLLDMSNEDASAIASRILEWMTCWGDIQQLSREFGSPKKVLCLPETSSVLRSGDAIT
jgi:hypothetical protein